MKLGGRWVVAVWVFVAGIAAAVVYGYVILPSHRVLTFSDGGHYVGAVRAGSASGHGVYTWPSGSRYEGEWRDGKPHGQGVRTSSSGSRYEGEWRDGKSHGYGVRTLADGDRSADRIVAEWIDGDLVFPARKVDRYEGEWRDGDLVFQVNEIPVRSPAFLHPMVRSPLPDTLADMLGDEDDETIVLHHPIREPIARVYAVRCSEERGSEAKRRGCEYLSEAGKVAGQ